MRSCSKTHVFELAQEEFWIAASKLEVRPETLFYDTELLILPGGEHVPDGRYFAGVMARFERRLCRYTALRHGRSYVGYFG